MRRRLLIALCLPSVLFLPLSLYIYSRPGLSEGLLYSIQPDNWVVVTAVPDGPAADAGVEAGDRIVSWNGISEPWEAIAALIRGPEDTQHTVELERGGVRHTVRFRLERQWLPGQKALHLSALLSLPLFWIPGFLLWIRGKGSAPSEFAAAFLTLAPSFDIYVGNWNSLGPILKTYPFHLGEILFVFHNPSRTVAALLLVLFANSFARPLLSSRNRKAVLGAAALSAILPLVIWPASVLWGTVPSWLWNALLWTFAFEILCPLTALILLFLQLRAVVEANERRRIRLLIAGLVPFFLANVLFFVGLLRLVQWLYLIVAVCWVLTACFPAAVLYALLKHRLFDVSVIIRRGLQYALARGSLAALTVIPVAAVTLHLYGNRGRPLEEVLGANAAGYLLAGAVIGGVAWKRETVLKTLDRRFFRDAYDPREVHLGIARVLTQRNDLERDGRQITAILTLALHAEYGALLTRPSRILLAGEPRELAPMPKTSRIPSLLELTGKPVEVDLNERKSFLRQLPEEDQELLRAWKAGVLAPVGDGKVEAILLLGEKLSEQPYSGEDLKLIQAVVLDFTAAYFTGPAAQRRPGDRMRECPRCGRCYAEDLEVCTTDGTALLDSALSLAVAGRYRLQRRLGMGGMGVVYQATDSELSRLVAVKVIRPESVADPLVLERFRREARSAAALSHRNIVAVFDFGALPEGGAFLVMEYLEGDTLRKMLPLPPAKALEVLEGVVAALDTAHRAGVVHRDLKPDNVMIASGWVKVLDFGLAKNLGSEEETLTRDGRLAGTVAYMAPEQLYGGNVDARSDIYALGVMTHEILTGQRPLHGQSQNGAVRRALSSQPSQRQTSAIEFLQELKSGVF